MALMNAKEFFEQLDAGLLETKSDPCGLCAEPLTETDLLEPPQFVQKNGETVRVHASCYYRGFGAELEPSPQGGHGVHHGCSI